MMHRRSLLIGSTLTAAVAATGAAQAGGLFGLFGDDAPQGAVYAQDGVAIRGTDPVAYFTEGKPVAGSAEHALTWGGTNWHFASAENRAKFEADPAAFAPQYGGYCAWAVAEKGELFSTDPSAWAIVDGKLYLNYNASIQDRWNKDIPGFIAEGDRRWPQIVQGS